MEHTVTSEHAWAVVEFAGIEIGDPAVARELRAALARLGVICVRNDAPLTEEAMRALVQMIGPIKDPLARTRDGSIVRYSEPRQIINSGYVTAAEDRARLAADFPSADVVRPGLFQYFHTDDSYTERPAAVSVLHARQLPPSGGGATSFIDMRAAYVGLDAATKRRIHGLSAVHAYDNKGAFPPRPATRGPLDALIDVAHPLVRRHPVAGTAALYFDLDRACHIAGMDIAEGRALLQGLQDHAERTAPRYDHRWRPHDVLMWDNASVQHAANADFKIGESRRFWRYMVEGEVPVGFDAPPV
jgi:alpha-ketoglutarate-dependent taurine dioxygenase